MNEKWANRFMDMADLISTWSKDRSTSVAAVIVEPTTNSVIATGYNGFPRGVNDDVDERHERPAKYMWVEHAERNAIYNAAAKGISTKDCLMVLPWYPCSQCARAIIQSRIAEVWCVEPDWDDERWGEECRIAKIMFDEAGVKQRFVDGRTLPVGKAKRG
jgi:dCMP deaminase